jgi:ABC-type sugar transport system substrate-binding protein/AraC-like DNA-binding protein
MSDLRVDLEYSESRKPILWVKNEKPVPPRPDDPASYPKDDFRHWYDMEYSGWRIKKAKLPQSPANGPKGKRVIGLLPGRHPYLYAFEKGMREVAEAFKMSLECLYCDWDDEQQREQVEQAIVKHPDLIILLPENAENCTAWFKEINAAGIPVIASNLMPMEEAYRYILSWTGPDDWGACRMLAGTFAERMNYEGGYCIVEHIPGTSAYYSRKWGVITELKRIAPKMRFLESGASGLRRGETREMVTRWLEKYGSDISGVFCSGDYTSALGLDDAVQAASRHDLVRVATGSSDTAVRLLKDGRLDAITFQSPVLDGALPIQVAVDWFNGLVIPPIRYLPIQVLTRENVDEFVFNFNNPEQINMDHLVQLVQECDVPGVNEFFRSIHGQFTNQGVLTVEYFKGFSIELISNLINILKANELSEIDILGDYETIFKRLFNQPSHEQTLAWLREVAIDIIVRLKLSRTKPPSFIRQVVEYVDESFRQPLSLKVLSNTFNITSAYLGKLFKEETGVNFTRYLNTLRIEEAKRLLLATGEKANRVALEVGYSDPNYFYNAFRKYTGMYPSEYMERHAE